MSIRGEALAWLAKAIGPAKGLVYTSRYHGSEESWTGAGAWWHEFSVLESLPAGEGFLYLLCQKPGTAASFYCLKVPLAFLREQRHGLQATPRGYRLHLSAQASNRFQDERGHGKVRFG